MSRRPRRVMAQMNVVPYIDVMLVLLVIFMVTAPMMQTGVNVDPPDTQANPLNIDNQQAPLIITVDQAGHIFNEQGQSLIGESLTTYVKQALAAQAQRPVYVRADGAVQYRYLMSAVVAAQQAGAKKIGLMADPVTNNKE